ncbi:MAG TPA: ribosome maturation factor RimP [Acidimicrobiales bacterium]|nr:ribosome maturation factor RimP [Acidimicrobiales bacterium]
MDDQVDDELSDLLASTVAPLGLEVVDIERHSTSVRVVVDRAGGVDLEAIASATRAVSAVLDAHDPFPGQRYTLEVSSPGVERRLRTPVHFERAVGEMVSVRTVAGGKGERRVTGRLRAADADGFVLEGDDLSGGERRLSYDEVERARTVFEWGSKSPAAARQGEAPRPAARPPRAAARKPAGRKTVATP